MDNQFSWLRSESGELPEHVSKEEHEIQQLTTSIHQQLIETLDLSRIGQMDREQMSQQLARMAQSICDSRRDINGNVDRDRLNKNLMSEVFGLGPLDPLLEDPLISDILVNDPHTVYIEKNGLLELTNITFADDAHLVRIIQRIVSRLGRRVDEVSPMVDARLPDGSRINAVIPPLALDGPCLSVRRFGVRPLRIDDLLENGTLLPEMVEFLRAAVAARLGCVISGGTGAGKTTLLNSLSAFVPDNERIVTIEDSAELILQHRHRIRMETRPPNAENSGEITQRDLVRNSLRMRPDRIIVGEVRGPEVWDMLQAMNTGHDGSLTTVHANSSQDALARLEMMTALSGLDVPVEVVRQYVALGVRLIVHVARLQGGLRRVTEITEILGSQGGHYQTQTIFGFQQEGVDDRGVARGDFFATGNVPESLDRIHAAGIPLSDSLFQKQRMEAPATTVVHSTEGE